MKFSLVLAFMLSLLSGLAHANAKPELIITGSTEQGLILNMKNAPLRTDAKYISISADTFVIDDIINKNAATTRIDERPEFYTESRHFKQPKLYVLITKPNFEKITRSIALIPGMDLSETIDLTGSFRELFFYIRGDQEIYKCFDSTTCKFKETRFKQIDFSSRPNYRLSSEEVVMSCDRGAVVISQLFADRSKYLLTIRDKKIRTHLGYRSKIQFVGNPNEFVGATAIFDRYYYRKTPYRMANVFPDYGGLKVKFETKPFDRCTYNKTSSSGYPYSYSHAIHPDEMCPNSDDASSPSRTTGQRNTKLRDWFFTDCESSQ